MAKIKHGYEIQEALELAECKDNSDDYERMLQTEWIRAKDVLEAIKQVARHDMNPQVCKGCNESHHYIACPYDILMNLDGTGKLNKFFEQTILDNPKEQSPENVGIKPSDAIPNSEAEQSPLSGFKSESVQAGRHRDNSVLQDKNKEVKKP